MSRKSIIALSILLGTLLTALSIATTLYLSWILAEKSELKRLAQFAEQATSRGLQALSEASSMLKDLQTLQLEPCSNQHIEKMRKLAFDSLIVAEVGYFENGRLTCNSWGMVNKEVPKVPADLIMPNGVEITFGINPIASETSSVIGLLYKNYNVLIDPARFTDIIADPTIQMAIVMKNGKIVSTYNKPDPKLIAAIVAGKNTYNDDLLFVLRKERLIIITAESEKYVLLKWYEQLITLLPFGLLMTLVLIGIVTWFSRRRLSPLGELKAAIARHEFAVHYQPIIELASGACIGAEALIGWPHKDGSWERPDLFIPLAEDNNLIRPITDQVINIVITDLKDFLNKNKHFHIAINVAAEDFKSGRILKIMNDAIANTGILPQQIWLEATERGLMDIDLVKLTLKKACELGYPVVIDDFGTGYSSLSYLQDLPLDALKIDKSFVDSLGKNSATSEVVEHIINMAQDLKLKMVAEGIETQTQADYLTARRVEYGQGWLFAKAMPVEKFMDYYEKNREQVGS